MKKKDPFQNQLYLEHKLAKNIVAKIMSLDPITIEWVKFLMKQWYNAVHFKNRVEICKDIFQTFIDNGIIDESTEIAGSYCFMSIHGRSVWFYDIIKLLEKNS